MTDQTPDPDPDPVAALLQQARPLPPPAERRRLREAGGLSRAAVAGALSVTESAVAGWERDGGSTPTGPARAGYTRLLDGLAEQYPATPPAAPPPATQTAAQEPPPADPDPVAVPDPHTAPAAPTAPPTVAESDAAAVIPGAVHQALTDAGGDTDTATAALIKRAIPDAMEILNSTRVGSRYDFTLFPPQPDILKKGSRNGADEIWEARPKWRHPELGNPKKAADSGVRMDVHVLDVNAAYLAAMKTWLPIGKLTHSESGEFDRTRAGVHLITPPEWHHPDLPSPMGDRRLDGPVWVAEPTLRLLLQLSGATGNGRSDPLCDPPVIHESWTSGATENLLEKMRRTIAGAREKAITEKDEVTKEYLKSMYSKFVSTLGESSANRDLRRQDWMHIIRAQAFTNLWRKARRAHDAGLTVIQVSGTDELHVSGDWTSVFKEGDNLADMKNKKDSNYVIGAGE